MLGGDVKPFLNIRQHRADLLDLDEELFAAAPEPSKDCLW
jgi:hypothetical protein